MALDPNRSDIETSEPGKPPRKGPPWVIVTAIALIIGLIFAFSAIQPDTATNNAADAAYQDNHEGSISDPASTQAVGVR